MYVGKQRLTLMTRISSAMLNTNSNDSFLLDSNEERFLRCNSASHVHLVVIKPSDPSFQYAFNKTSRTNHDFLQNSFRSSSRRPIVVFRGLFITLDNVETNFRTLCRQRFQQKKHVQKCGSFCRCGSLYPRCCRKRIGHGSICQLSGTNLLCLYDNTKTRRGTLRLFHHSCEIQIKSYFFYCFGRINCILLYYRSRTTSRTAILNWIPNAYRN